MVTSTATATTVTDTLTSTTDTSSTSETSASITLTTTSETRASVTLITTSDASTHTQTTTSWTSTLTRVSLTGTLLASVSGAQELQVWGVLAASVDASASQADVEDVVRSQLAEDLEVWEQGLNVVASPARRLQSQEPEEQTMRSWTVSYSFRSTREIAEAVYQAALEVLTDQDRFARSLRDAFAASGFQLDPASVVVGEPSASPVDPATTSAAEAVPDNHGGFKVSAAQAASLGGVVCCVIGGMSCGVLLRRREGAKAATKKSVAGLPVDPEPTAKSAPMLSMAVPKTLRGLMVVAPQPVPGEQRPPRRRGKVIQRPPSPLPPVPAEHRAPSVPRTSRSVVAPPPDSGGRLHGLPDSPRVAMRPSVLLRAKPLLEVHPCVPLSDPTRGSFLLRM